MEKYCSRAPFVVLEMFDISIVQTGSHMWLLNTWNVVDIMEVFNFNALKCKFKQTHVVSSYHIEQFNSAICVGFRDAGLVSSAVKCMSSDSSFWRIMTMKLNLCNTTRVNQVGKNKFIDQFLHRPASEWKKQLSWDGECSWNRLF